MHIKIYFLNLFLFCIISTSVYPQAINKEAENEINNVRDLLYVNYSGDRFSMTLINSNNYLDTSQWQKTLYQYKNLKIAIETLPVSYIDSLNGFEWKGNILISASACRHIKWSTKSNEKLGYQSWTDWVSFEKILIPFNKRRGIWSRKFLELGPDIPNHLPSVEDIQRALKRPPNGIIRSFTD